MQADRVQKEFDRLVGEMASVNEDLKVAELTLERAHQAVRDLQESSGPEPLEEVGHILKDVGCEISPEALVKVRARLQARQTAQETIEANSEALLSFVDFRSNGKTSFESFAEGGGTLHCTVDVLTGARGRRQRQWRTAKPLRRRAPGQGPWALDPLQSLDRSLWARLPGEAEPREAALSAPLLLGAQQAQRPLRVSSGFGGGFSAARPPARMSVLVYGYHPVLIEPISALLHFEDYAERIQLNWYGISERDCSFFTPLCDADRTRREAKAAVPAGLRWKVYESSWDEEEILAAYEKFWEAEQAESARADLVLAMELRDAYFLWRVCEAATIYYAALIFLQDEAMSDYAAEVYLRQFDAFRENDVLNQLKLEGQPKPPSPRPPTAMVAQSPYIAASIQYHTNQTLPCVRPLALYVGANLYAPNRSEASLLVLCARTRLMMSHACRGLFREGRRALSRTGPRLFLPSGDRDVVHGLSFAEVATFHAAVLIPWNIAVTTFHEFYALHVPVFVPDELWLARLWPKQMTSYGKAHPNLHRQLRPNRQHPTPYPSLDSLATDFWIMLYWAENYAGIYEMPGVQKFASIPELLFSLKQKISENPLFFEMMSREMQEETQRARGEVLVFWRDLAGILTASAHVHGAGNAGMLKRCSQTARAQSLREKKKETSQELFSGGPGDESASASQQTQTRREVKLAMSLASRLDAMQGPEALQEAKDEASGILQRDPSLARFLTEIGWVYANRADVYLASSGSLLGSWSVSALSSRASGHGHQASQQMRTAKLAAHSFVKLRRIVKEADEKEGTTSTDGEEPAESYRGLRRGAAAPQELPESLSSALPTFMETFWSLSSHDITGTLDKVIARVLRPFLWPRVGRAPAELLCFFSHLKRAERLRELGQALQELSQATTATASESGPQGTAECRRFEKAFVASMANRA
eukprot:s5702_g8.t2